MTNDMTNEQTSTNTRSGRVVAKLGHGYQVDVDGVQIACTLATRLSKQLDRTTTDPVAVGDQVEVARTDAAMAQITAITPRRNWLSRPATGKKAREQIIAANLDQMVTVFAAARPKPTWNLLDRYIVTAEAADIPVVIAITKLDIGSEADLEADLSVYRALGYRVLLTSAATGAGVAEFRAALTGMVSVLVGKSGVGKSSLLNAVQPGLDAAVSGVSDGRIGKGKHTTTGSTLFALADGGYLIDTPGVREFGLWDVDAADVAVYFRELKPLLGACKFGLGCTHQHEPGCALRDAVAAGDVTERRFNSYLRLQSELDR